ncbi:MAG: hypothetical protein IPN79_02505 [Saprospiraceae bacterium]|nr:hypothetical protein [Saprospiraceae bacterium]
MTPFSPPDASFDVKCPGTMDYGEKHVLTDLGEMKTITYLYREDIKNPDPIYIINYTDFPKGTLDADSIDLVEEFFKTSFDGILTNLKGEIIYYADISALNMPQKIYKINYNNGQAILKGKMLISGDRFFSVQVFSSLSQSDKPEIDGLLDSFKVNLK